MFIYHRYLFFKLSMISLNGFIHFSFSFGVNSSSAVSSYFKNFSSLPVGCIYNSTSSPSDSDRLYLSFESSCKSAFSNMQTLYIIPIIQIELPTAINAKLVYEYCANSFIIRPPLIKFPKMIAHSYVGMVIS